MNWKYAYFDTDDTMYIEKIPRFFRITHIHRNFKMDHISCKQNRSHLSYFEWQASANSLNVFFSCVHRTLKKIWSYTLFIPKHFSLFIQRLSEIFSALQKLIEMKHFDIWRRMKRVWSLRVHKRISGQAFIDSYPIRHYCILILNFLVQH